MLGSYVFNSYWLRISTNLNSNRVYIICEVGKRGIGEAHHL